LIVPPAATARELAQIAKGQRRAADALGCAVIGGNLACGDALSVTTTVLGEAGTLMRSGARVGDELWLLGDVGLSALGLRLLRRGKRRGTTELERVALAAFREPRARVADGLALARVARAAIDVSDGLAGDAAHIAEASGVRCVLELAALRRSLHPTWRGPPQGLAFDPVELALYGGEDYALLATGTARNRPRRAQRIGRVLAGRGVWLDDGEKLSAARGGFEHF
jgi:thiamine-monophosphate kinase